MPSRPPRGRSLLLTRPLREILQTSSYLSENYFEVLISVYLRALSDPHRACSAWRAYPAFLTYPTHRIVDPTSVSFREEIETRPPFLRTLLSSWALSTESGYPEQPSRLISSETRSNTLYSYFISSFDIPQTHKQGAMLLRPARHQIQNDATTANADDLHHLRECA